MGQTAVVRGRLMELLAAEMLTPEEVDNAFIVGMFSLLDPRWASPWRWPWMLWPCRSRCAMPC